MTILTHNELIRLVEDGVIENVDPANVNGASIDLTLADGHYVEEAHENYKPVIDLGLKQIPYMEKREGGVKLRPGDFVLAATEQIFHLPNDIAGHYMLKSSLARAGLQHLFAGFADPGWHGSALTLELTSCLRHHILVLEPGDKIGQMVFWRGEPVPDEESYAARGQYNGCLGVQQSKGMR